VEDVEQNRALTLAAHLVRNRLPLSPSWYGLARALSSNSGGKSVPKTSLAVRGFQCLLACAALVATLFISTGSAQAQATVFSLSDTSTETFTAPLEGCLPQDLVGTVTLTETISGQVVDTGKNVFTVHGVNTYDYHLDLPDGIYVQSWLNREHFTFVANPPLTVFNVVGQDFRKIYAADGTLIGTLSINEVSHITFRDTNGNGQPDPGEITAELDHFHLRCG
jgi:hypothetical protein